MRGGAPTAPVAAVLFVAGAFASTAPEQEAEARLRGQVVCSACWFEADRGLVPYGTEADLECAADCAAKGIPAALAVPAGDGFTLYILEAGGHRPGPRGWLGLISKQVEVRGVVGVSGDRKRIRVSSVRVLEGEAAHSRDPGSTQPEWPGLELQDLAGVRQSLASLRGRIVVLNFWATWCAPCRQEMPALAGVQSRFGAWGVQVVGASVDAPGDRAQVEAFARKLEVNFPVWVGAGTEDMVRFGLPPALPGTVILDREGRVVARFPRAVRDKDLAAAIEPLLRAAPAVDVPAGASAEAVGERGRESSRESEPVSAARSGEAPPPASGDHIASRMPPPPSARASRVPT